MDVAALSCGHERRIIFYAGCLCRIRTSRTCDRPGPGPRPKTSPKRPSRARGGGVCVLFFFGVKNHFLASPR
jgi:hypothetical protein